MAGLIKTHRLVTLIGEGGVGKTRLAVEVVRRLLPGFPDGVGVAELAALSEPGLVPVTVAVALGLKFAAGVISAERVADALGEKQLVLVLDNCEHVIDAATHIARMLLHSNPAIRVLATSRATKAPSQPRQFALVSALRVECPLGPPANPIWLRARLDTAP